MLYFVASGSTRRTLEQLSSIKEFFFHCKYICETISRLFAVVAHFYYKNGMPHVLQRVDT